MTASSGGQLAASSGGGGGLRPVADMGAVLGAGRAAVPSCRCVAATLLTPMWLVRGCPQIEWYLPRGVRFRVTFVGMGKRWGRRGVAAAVVGLVGMVGVSACGSGEDESSDSSEGTAGGGGTESESATESTSDESPSGSEEAPSGEESSSGGEVSTADVEFTEWELERRATPPPERPAEMDDPGEAGAIATAEYFVELLAFAEETGVIEGLEDISSQSCEYCERFFEIARQGVVDGEYSTDTGLVILGSASASPRNDGSRVVVVDAEYAGSDTLNSYGEPIDSRSGWAFTQYVHVESSADGWLVRDSHAAEIEGDA